MPELDGFAVLEQLKADPQLRDVRIIVTSSVEGMDNIVRCIKLGAEDYLYKPVNQVLLKPASAPFSKKASARPAEGISTRFATSEVAETCCSRGSR